MAANVTLYEQLDTFEVGYDVFTILKGLRNIQGHLMNLGLYPVWINSKAETTFIADRTNQRNTAPLNPGGTLPYLRAWGSLTMRTRPGETTHLGWYPCAD